MRLPFLGGLCASLVLVSAAAAAEDQPKNEPDAVPSAEKIVCHSEAQLGSILRKRVCHTRAEWKDIKARDEATTKRVIEDSGVRRAGPDHSAQ